MNPDTPLQLLGGISAREFMRDYWQKKPLLVRQAFPDFISPIDPDELSRRLGMEPQHAWRAGERRRGDDGELGSGVYRETYWVGLLPPGPPFGPMFGTSRRGPLAVGIADNRNQT